MKDIIKELGITDIEFKKLWSVWVDDWQNWSGGFDSVWFGYNELSVETGITVKVLKKIMKILRDLNFAYISPLMNDECMLQGSGTFLYNRYVDMDIKEIKSLMESDNAKDKG